MPSYPDPGWGAVVAFRPVKALQVDVAWTEGAPDATRLRPSQTSLLSDGLLLAEVTVHSGPLLGRRAGGSYHLGAWLQPRVDSQPAGAWLMAEEPVWTRANDLVALFVQWSWRRGRPPATVQSSIAGGVVAQGLVPHRHDDVLALAATSAALVGGRETAVELFYKAALLGSTMWVFDLQRIQDVGGAPGVHAWVGTTRLSVQL